jgi:glyoxylase-like metal-dependent hydrolase (beta-lactamase superfamily II)
MKTGLFNIANFKVDGGAMFGVIPRAMWSRAYKPDDSNLITLPLRSLIVDTGDRKVLVDTGWGDKQDAKFFRYVFLHGGEGLTGGLRARGYSAEDITDVFLTHLHADHCGGALKRSDDGKNIVPAFPNATIHVSRVQYEWAVKNNIREEDSYPPENILPMKDSGKLNLIERDGELFPGFSLFMCYGHTPGLMIPVVKHSDKTLVYTGDLIPTSAHIPLIWNMSYDIETLKTIEEKERLLKEAFEKGWILVFQHDENVECCNLGMTPKGIRAREKFLFSELSHH